jgi:hypothetical protein
MENAEIINLWKFYDKKLEESLLLNRKNAEDITKIKAREFLISMTPLKLFTIVVGILWVIFVDILIVKVFASASPYFLISAGLHVLLTKVAIVIYHNQSVLIRKVDISDPINATQEKIARLKSSTLWVARLLFLQFPLWTTFYLNDALLKSGNVVFYGIQAVTTISFTFLAIWLFLNIKFENKEKKWFRLIFTGKEWSPLIKSMELLNQLNDYSHGQTKAKTR